jgi:sulfatase maturation enzyme AslB (radical SAM superfamily)
VQSTGAIGRGFTHLPVELFRTGGAHFAFDAGKVVFVEVDRTTFDILRLLRRESLSQKDLAARLPQHPAADVRRACRELAGLRRRGYLNPRKLVRVSPHARAEFETVLTRRLSGLTVFLTARCNLACSYCVYGARHVERGFPPGATMTWDTARNTLAFLHRHSTESESIQLQFFGGEPLLAFDLLRRCVEHWREISGPKMERTDLVVITNGTLLRGEPLDFLIRNRIYVQVSLDGDSAAHDSARRYRETGRGSFDDVFANLAALYDRDPEYVLRYVHVKSVIARENLEKDDRAFWSHPVLEAIRGAGNLARIVVRPSYEPAHDSGFLWCVKKVGAGLLKVRGARTLAELTSALNEKERVVFDRTLAHFYKVQAANLAWYRDTGEVPFHKSCFMGFNEGVVLPGGDIAVCVEATSHVIGNVNEGRWHFDRIAEMNDRLHGDWPACSGCFVGRFCPLCWQCVPGEGAAWRNGRIRFCRFTRQYYRTIFTVMLRVLARNPALWEDLRRAVREEIEKIRAAGQAANA